MSRGNHPISIAKLRIDALNAPMREPFEIATGTQTEVRNLLVTLRLSDGTTGFGECAPAPHLSSETQDATLGALSSARKQLEGMNASALDPLFRTIDKTCGNDSRAKAALEMALFDAWAQRLGLPLYVYFGGAEDRLMTDVTVPILAPEEAAAAARKILGRGISTIKIKIGKNLDEDEARIRAVVKSAPKSRIILDANQGYRPGEALNILRRMRDVGIRPALFEQPVAKADLDGLAEVQRMGGVPVAADESASSLKDIWRIAKKKAASVINIKFMKFGVREAWDAARAARAAGLGLMMGGMVESRLAMGCAAHFAAGIGGFDFIDLDTPLWFAKDPIRGPLRIGPGGVYDLRLVKSGIGLHP
jgi:L-alanine-DL-glutamate epimerase-like enolase superfamily enzyme